MLIYSATIPSLTTPLNINEIKFPLLIFFCCLVFTGAGYGNHLTAGAEKNQRT